MKKLVFIIVSILMFSALALSINAGTDHIIPNPPLTVEITSPTVDGNITKTEGWSEPSYMNEDTLNYWKDTPLAMWAEVRFAVDQSGFYFSADILDPVSSFKPEFGNGSWKNQFCPSKGSPFESENAYYCGDCFTLNIDPLGKLYDIGYVEGFNIVPAYTVSMFEDGNVYIRDFRPVTLTEGALVVGSVTEGGWCFEAWVSWDNIINDVYDITDDYGFAGVESVLLDKNDILSHNATVKVGTVYYDRYYDGYGSGIDTYNIYCSAPAVLKSGRYGYDTVREVGIDSLGIELTVSNTCTHSGSHRWSDWIRIMEPTYYEKGREVSICNRCGEVLYREVDVLEYKNSFVDVKNSHWYAEGVRYCVMKGYMCGMSPLYFEPNSMLTREQCVLILANLFDVDTSKYKNEDSGFQDVPTGKWYSGAIAWATDVGLIKGMSEDTFGRGQYIKRDAFARILYVAAERMGMPMKGRADLTKYVDHDKVQDWAYDELAWAVVNGIIVSTKDDVYMLSPRDEVKRAQCATMIWQMGELYEKYFEMGLIEDIWR